MQTVRDFPSETVGARRLKNISPDLPLRNTKGSSPSCRKRIREENSNLQNKGTIIES